MNEIVDVYYHVGDYQFHQIIINNYRGFPPKWFKHPLRELCFLLDKANAINIAQEKSNWNEVKTKSIHTLRFLMKRSWIEEKRKNENSFVISSNDIDLLNSNIIGYVERISKIDVSEN